MSDGLRNKNHKVFHTILLTISLSQGIPAFAELEEIIVTARKREESILKVPVVASVLSGEKLEQYGTGDLYGAVEKVPGLVLGSGTLGFGAQVSLRGVGTSTLNTTIDQSVSLNIDGMQMAQGLAYSAGMFDMAQLEVLKGPQALFFGKASPGGVISITTAGPTEEFEMILREGYEFEAQENRTDFIVSGPVMDTLGARLAVTRSSSQGYYTNKAEALDTLPILGTPSGAQDPRERDFGSEDEWMVRGTLQFEPTEVFSAKLKLNMTHSRVDGDGGQGQLASCPDGLTPPPTTLGFPIPFIGGGENCDIDDTVRIVDVDPAVFVGVRNHGTPFLDQNQKFGTLELNFEVTPELTLTSLTGYYELDQDSMINGLQTSYAGPTLVADPTFEIEDLSQEFRLTSDFVDSPLNFMLGIYYQKALQTYHNNLLGNTSLFWPAQINKGYQDIDIDTWSGFGQLIWAVTPELEVALGARWTREDRYLKVINTITGTPVRVAISEPLLEEEDVSPELTITYRPTDTLTVFGALKRGFKSGSFDTVTIPSDGQNKEFDNETVKGGEIGMKALLLDGSMQFNAALYYYEYDDLQVGANEVTESGAVDIRTVNAASAIVQGVDLDLTWAPSSLAGFTVYGAVNYNDSYYDSFENSKCYGGQTIAMGCDQVFDITTGLYTAQDLSSDPLMRAPDWTASIGADYEMLVGDGLTLVLGWNTTYSDDYLTNILARNDMEQESYVKHNLSIALRGADDAWEVALIGNNLDDEQTTGNCVNYAAATANFPGAITGGVSNAPWGVDELSCNMERGRSLWIRISAKLSEFL